MKEEKKEEVQLGQLGINYRVIPVFSDRSITASQVASIPGKKEKEKAERKEGTLRILFIDSVSNSTVADVVMTSIAAQQLAAGIAQTLERMKKEIASPLMPVQVKPEHSQQTYIG